MVERHIRKRAMLSGIFCLMVASVIQAQTLASLSVKVQDATGAVIPGAKIVLTSQKTGLQREKVTSDAGVGRIVDVPPGVYELRVSAEGFQDVVQAIQLAVGQAASVEVTLPVAAVQEVVTVQAVADQVIDLEKTEVSQVIDERRIEDLPINGRNFIDFVLLTPSVVIGNSTSVGSQAPFTETTLKLSFGGVRETHSAFISLDGVDYTTSISGVQRANPSQDWVQEFRVVNNTYAVDTGRSLGGIVNTVTKSGTNEFHGEIYEFFRNNSLDAKSPLSSPGFDKLRLNQFGVTMSGPLAKNRTFFFGGYEGQRRAESPLYSNFILQNIDAINAVKQSFGLSAEDLSSILKINDYDQFIAKVDHQFTASTTLGVRYLFTDQRNPNTPGAPPGLGLPGTFRDNPIRDQTLIANLIHLFSPAWTGDTVVQFARRTFHLTPVGAGREPFLAIPNLVQTGGPVGSFTFYRESRLQLGQNVTYTRGAHLVKFGGEFHNIWNTTKSPMFTPAVVVFTPESFFGLPPFTRPTAVVFYFGQPRSLFGQQLPPRGTDWQASLLPPPMAEEFDRASTAEYTHQLGAFYVQDQWRIASNFTLTFGLRYDVETRPFGDKRFFEEDLNNFQPRLGFSYSFHEARGVLRGGAGIFTAPFNWSDMLGTLTAFGAINGYLDNPLLSEFANPESTLIGLANFGPLGVLPGPFTAGPAFARFTRDGSYPSPQQLIGFSHGFAVRDFPNPYAENASLQLEYEISRGIAVSAGYLFVHAVKIPYYGHANARPIGTLPNGKTAMAPADPHFGFAFLFTPSAFSIYHAGMFSVTKRFSHHFSLTANYTYSKSIDNQSTIQFVTGPQNYFRRDLERGVSDNHIGQRFVLTWLFESPSRWVILRDWKVGVITTLQSPRYTSVLVGFDANGDGFPFPDRVGALGRNTYKGDDFQQVDLRLQRRIPFGERVRGTFSVEFFNLFNHVNVLDVNNVYGATDLVGPVPREFGDGVRGAVPSFGTPRNVGNMRQIQFSFRISF